MQKQTEINYQNTNQAHSKTENKITKSQPKKKKEKKKSDYYKIKHYVKKQVSEGYITKLHTCVRAYVYV